MEVKLRKFNIIDYFRFLKLKLNKESSKELNSTFFGYILKGLKSLFKREEHYKFAIFVNGQFGGSIALFNPKSNIYEVGFFVLKKYRNKGIATKATKEILNFGFKKLKLNKIVAITDMNNKASQKILKKVGFKKIKENKKKREFLWEKSH